MALKNIEIQVAVPYIVTNEEHRFPAEKQLCKIDIEMGAALLESACRNTTPALARSD